MEILEPARIIMGGRVLVDGYSFVDFVDTYLIEVHF